MVSFDSCGMTSYYLSIMTLGREDQEEGIYAMKLLPSGFCYSNNVTWLLTIIMIVVYVMYTFAINVFITDLCGHDRNLCSTCFKHYLWSLCDDASNR